MRRLAPLLALVVLVAAGCGKGDKTHALPTTVEGTLPTTTAPAGPKGDPAAGKKVFASAGCGGCHTLADAGSTGNVGPNLDQAMPPLDLIVDRVTNGKSPMPSFKGQLSDQQIADVAAYVFQSTHS